MSCNHKHWKSIFYLHIPKCAGRTIISHLEEHIVNEDAFIVGNNERVLFDLDELKRRRLVAGHQTFPMAALFNEYTFKFTFLRNPIERTISAFHYIQRNTSHELHTELIKRKINDPGDFCSDPFFRFHSSNMQTRFLGLNYEISSVLKLLMSKNVSIEQAMGFLKEMETVEINEGNLTYAKENLMLLDFFGLQKNFEKSMHCLFLRLGSHTKFSNSKFNNSSQEQHALYNKKTLQKIADFNVLDLELYEFAKKAFADINLF